MAGYIALIRKDADSDFGVDFPDFPGCLSAGATLDEARRMAQEALELHVGGMTAVEPFATGAVYVNHLDTEEATRIRAAYSSTKSYQRLVALKMKYDPTNLFRLNQNIRLTG